MDAYDIRKKLIKKIAGENSIIFTPEDRLVRKLSKSLNFTYMVISNDSIFYIVHEAQDDDTIDANDKILTIDPDSELKKIVLGKKILSPEPEKFRNLKAEFIDLTEIFRKPYDDEIQIFKNGASLIDQAFEKFINNIKIGMKEFEIKAEIDYAIMKMGFESFSYPTVVLTGERTSIPLGKTSDRILENGDIIQIDFSPVLNGYEFSMARVIFTELNENTKDLWKKYNKVFEIVSPYLKPGVECNKIDSITRNYIQNLGFSYPHYSGYPLGGFSKPNIYPGSNDYLERNNVFVFSPGLYIKKKFGFRIKRMIHINDDGFETFDKFGE